MRQGNASSLESSLLRRRFYEPARRILSEPRLPGKGTHGRGQHLDSRAHPTALSLYRLRHDVQPARGHALLSPLHRRSDDHLRGDLDRVWLSSGGDRGRLRGATADSGGLDGCGRAAVRSGPSAPYLPAARSRRGAGGRNPGAAAGADRLAGAGADGDDPALARWRRERTSGRGIDRAAVYDDPHLCIARAARGLRGWICGVCAADQTDGADAPTTAGKAGALSTGRVVGLGDRAGRQAARGWSRRRGDTPDRPWHRRRGVPALEGRNDPDGVYRAIEWDVSGATGESGAPDTRSGPDGGAIGAGDVAGGHGLQLLHAAPQFGAGTNPRDGGGNQRSAMEHR